MERETEKALENLVRIGTVTDVDGARRRVRVKFRNTGMTSGWLPVVQHFGAELYVEPDAEHTHDIADTFTGGGSAGMYPAHDHLPGSHVTYWLPRVNDTVLTLYLPVFNGDGFVMGGL